MAEKRGKNWKIVLAVVIALLIIMAVVAHVPTGPVKIITSRETTVINGPLNPDGTVNYVAALEAEYAAGVTPENNAAIILLKALGSSMLPDQTRGQILSRLGLTVEEIDDGRHFVSWGDRASVVKVPAQTRPALAPVVPHSPPDGLLGPDSLPPGAPPPGRARGFRLPVSGPPKEVLLGDVMDMLDDGDVYPDLQPWLDENAEPLRLVEEATWRPRFYIPFVAPTSRAGMIDVEFPNPRILLEASRALVLRARLKRRNGDIDDGWADILTVHRLARLLQQGPTVVQQLVAISIESMAAQIGIELATREGLAAEKAGQLLAQLVALKPVGDVVGSIDRLERFFFLDVIMMLSRGRKLEGMSGGGPLPKTSGLDWNEMLRAANKWYDQIVESMRLPRFEGRAEAQRAYSTGLSRLVSRTRGKGRVRMILLRLGGRPFRRALTRDVTDVLIIILMPTLFRAQEIQDEVRTRSDMEKLAIALAWSKAEKGRYPAKLAELAPRYLPTIPRDRFSPDPLIYRAKGGGYIVYSVGADQVDDGGTKKDDIAAEAKPAKP